MDEMIKRILQIEDKAKEIVSEADSMREHLGEQVDREVNIYEQECERRAKARIEKMREFENKEAQKIINEIQEKTNQKAERIESQLKDKKEHFAGLVFERVVGDD